MTIDREKGLRRKQSRTNPLAISVVLAIAIDRKVVSKRERNLPASTSSNNLATSTPAIATRSSSAEVAATAGVISSVTSSVAGETSITTVTASVAILGSNRLLAADLRVAHFLTIRALNTRPILWLGALSALVTFGVTVAANNLARVRAILLTMTFLTAIVASTAAAASLRAVTRKVANYCH